MSTVHGGPGNIVTNGLVLNLDAANPRSYPPPYNGTVWRDLSGNNKNGTLTNGLTFSSAHGGGIVFDGVDDYVTFPSTQTHTVHIWAKADVGFTNGLQGIICNSLNGDGSLRFENNSFRIASADLNDMQTGYPLDLWINGVKNPRVNNSYYQIPDGRSLTQNFFVSVKADPTRYTSTVSTLSHNFNSRRFKGIIYSVLLYNRWLTDTEILQNFNATRARFGI